jgi:isopenicillin N synthase-like dioxygenase
MASFPVIDLSSYLHKSGDWESSCTEIAGLLRQFGMLIVKDERVDPSLNTTFLDMMEQYYEQPTEVRDQDSRPEVHYQESDSQQKAERRRFLPVKSLLTCCSSVHVCVLLRWE